MSNNKYRDALNWFCLHLERATGKTAAQFLQEHGIISSSSEGSWEELILDAMRPDISGKANPCPFCGSNTQTVENIGLAYRIACGNKTCTLRGKPAVTIEDALKKWNTVRTPHAGDIILVRAVSAVNGICRLVSLVNDLSCPQEKPVRLKEGSVYRAKISRCLQRGYLVNVVSDESLPHPGDTVKVVIHRYNNRARDTGRWYLKTTDGYFCTIQKNNYRYSILPRLNAGAVRSAVVLEILPGNILLVRPK